ncbi:hypothetical protein TGCAST_306688 [Toxoplasma gondii CAST]|uniref:Uncharacterized protein n=1 Tax=Toxoplasma gondii CAST TaxID=943122 RepID=A0A425HPV8_TOXGO|nr:hypothetical protein TGCAST_306688 [Toxoplasma gondii CAST]
MNPQHKPVAAASCKPPPHDHPPPPALLSTPPLLSHSTELRGCSLLSRKMVNQQNAPRSVNSPSRPAHAIPHLLSYSIHARPVPSDMLLARSGAPPISAEQPSPSPSTRPPPSSTSASTTV